MVDFIQLSAERLVILYGLYMIIVVIFLWFAANLYKRGARSRQKAFIARFFIFVAIGLIINAIYAPMDSELIQSLGNKTVIFLTTIAHANLLFFAISVQKSEIEFTPKKAWLYTILVAIVSIGYYLFPITFKSDYSPVWTVEIFVFALILTQSLMISAFVIIIKINRTIENPAIKQRMLNLFIGIIMLEFVMISTLMRNAQFISGILSILPGLLIIPGGLLIYFGVGKKLDKDQS